MGSGKKIKFAFCEIVQFAALCIPVFVVMQRFASIVKQVKEAGMQDGDASTAYWLIMASSVAYVTSVALVIWVPMKYMIAKKRKFFTARKGWRPVTLVYVILSTLPCFAFLIASSEVQINAAERFDMLSELPVSLVLLSFICVDIIDRLRKCRLTGQNHTLEDERDADIPSPILTHLEQVTTVSGQMDVERDNDGTRIRLEANGTAPGLLGNQERQYSISGLSSRTASTAYNNSPYTSSGPFKFLHCNDTRAEIFVDSFIFWFDTVEMVRVAGHPQVYFSRWVFPIYIFSYISMLRLILKPRNPLLSSLGVILQDIPFLFIRIALISIFGCVTPLLYLFKNLFVVLAFIYFNFMTKMKMFNTERMF